MIKADLAKSLAEKNRTVNEKQAKHIVDDLLSIMFTELDKPDGALYLRGLGTFKNIKTRERKARNISKNEAITVPPQRKVKFIPSKSFGK